ncbi:hypothetical protein ACTHQ2_22725, partial [Bacillus subtilis]
TLDTPEVHLHVKSEKGVAYRYLITNQITMNVNEYELPVHVTKQNGELSFKADRSSLSAEVYPNLEYRMRVNGAQMKVGDETELASGVNAGDASLTTLQ